MSEIIEHPEYNSSDNPYPSFGKKYAGERGVISLTSWRARISTVSKTLFSLIQQCPGFHIVLVLSEEEFPKMCEELPENLMLFVENEMIELLFVYKNYKSFKKVLFTMDKYRDVPVISADDDCIYTCNYAQVLYNNWAKNKNDIFYCSPGEGSGWGYIWPANVFIKNGIYYANKLYKQSMNDDLLYIKLAEKLKIKKHCLNIKSMVCHDTVSPINMGNLLKQKGFREKENKLFNDVLKS